MPFVMSYTNSFGTYSSSYWFVSAITCDSYHREGVFTFTGFPSKTYYENTASPISIGTHQYVINNEDDYIQSLAYAIIEQGDLFTLVNKLENFAFDFDTFFQTATFISSLSTNSQISSISIESIEITEYTSSNTFNVALYLNDIPSSVGTSDGFSITVNGNSVTGFSSGIVVDAFTIENLEEGRILLGLNSSISPSGVILLSYNNAVGNIVDLIDLPFLGFQSLPVKNLIGSDAIFDGIYNSGQLVVLF